MTYIVALGQPGMNTIFADSRVSWNYGRQGRNDGMKIGLLFPGCIYAMLGNVFAAREFVRSFKESIYSTTDTIAGFWERSTASHNVTLFARRRHTTSTYCCRIEPTRSHVLGNWIQFPG